VQLVKPVYRARLLGALRRLCPTPSGRGALVIDDDGLEPQRIRAALEQGGWSDRDLMLRELRDALRSCASRGRGERITEAS
jgi:hypothetical protein